MSQRIKAFIVNRNLYTSLKGTIDFLKADPRVDVIVVDMQSTYPPLLQYYEGLSDVIIHYCEGNYGPYHAWNESLNIYRNDEPFIVADSDCNYEGVPSDWLDKMLDSLERCDTYKVAFSLSLDGLPDTEMTPHVLGWEAQYWLERNECGFKNHVDTTFAMYRPHHTFDYPATRLDKPYTIKHLPWYIVPEQIDEEWLYYVKHAAPISTWGTRIKNALNLI